ncbi:YopX family protein [Bacillus atrophaeus]|uniref:YopX family protein n=1 Tax=Bacillus atrophaeus TaxID=1452 RepID=UPI00228286D4|nr:YopX family protein [Bacillus atrophaeus]MCY8813651.1 YopX family protein [Bacillus atrophaeus]MCY8820276.1 YopX family protein [Bacillus atrophaeus]MCY8828600.1 YopX family protein [Bacillus atrophaeus]MCY8832687.1 YopX family protein [Bacillus atrophaeus]MEC0749779.1 YopX family protein [Bacillus atrophaeus]
MNTAYRVWDGEQMHYWDDEGLVLTIKNNGDWALKRLHTDVLIPVVDSTNRKADLMWGTGLEDKNEKMIYDKDSILDHDTDTRFVVKYDNKQAGFYLDIGIGKGSGAFMVGDLEVIGDVYQNPELLEGAE